jgi:5-oxoprolinase (ATP-hydrolysing) subunit A
VLTDVEVVAERAVRIATDNEVVAVDGTVVRVRARSICVHGDTPGAVDLARAVRDALDAAGVGVYRFTD